MTPPLIQHFFITIVNLDSLWNSLKNLGCKYLFIRSLNQDFLDNVFGIIRGWCGQNLKPMCARFLAAYNRLGLIIIYLEVTKMIFYLSGSKDFTKISDANRK